MEKAQGILQQTKQLKDKIEGYNSLVSQYEDLMTIIEMGNEEDDASMVAEAEEVKKDFLESLKNLEFLHFLQDLMTKIMPLLHFILVLVVQRPVTGFLCSTECIAVG